MKKSNLIFKGLFAGLAAFALAACATTPPADLTNNLKVGMERAEVIEVLGEPVKSRKSGENELMRYVMFDAYSGDKYQGKDAYYFVHLIEGEVFSFGRFGDFRQLEDLEKNSVANRIEELKPGMARFQVIDLLGEPHHALERSGLEYLNYIHVPREYYRGVIVKGDPEPYFVKLKYGQVIEFGRMKDIKK